MSEVEDLESRIAKRTTQESARLRDWFPELDSHIWDQQIEAGKFRGLIDEAREGLARGEAREL